MVAPVVLVEASPRRASDGATVPTRLAGGGGSHAYFYGGEHWRAGIVSLPSVVSSVEFDGENMGGGGIPQALELRWAPGSNAALADAAAQFWIDAPITVRLGAEGGVRLADGSFTLPPAILSGSALGASVSKGTLVVPMAARPSSMGC
jgi:hypothetical protein